MMGIFAAYIVATYIAALLLIIKTQRCQKLDIVRIIMPGFIIATILGIIAAMISIFVRLDKPQDELSDKLDELDPKKQSSCRIIKNVDNDKKYFYNSKGEEDKAEFDKLQVAEMRNKKIYYELGYKSVKNDATEKTVSDIEEYFGGRDKCNEFIKNLKDVNESFGYLHILTAWVSLLSLFMTLLVLALSGLFYMNWLRTQDEIYHTERQEAWLNKCGLVQSLTTAFTFAQYYITKWHLHLHK